MSDPVPAASFFPGRESTTRVRGAVRSPASRYARSSGVCGPTGVKEGASRSAAVWATRATEGPRRNQLGVIVNGRPDPHVTHAPGATHGLGHVLGLGVDEDPHLVTLNALAREDAAIRTEAWW